MKGKPAMLKLINRGLFVLLAMTAGCTLAQSSPDWRTPTEISGYRTTPDYAETMAYIERVAAAAPGEVKIENFGKTGEGRELKIVIVSKGGVFDPAAIHASGRAILLSPRTERICWIMSSSYSSRSTTLTAMSGARPITVLTRTGLK